MSKLFISHATADRPFVENELKGLLDALGFDVWFAEGNIQSAELWERSIKAGLEASEWFLLVMTPRSAKSEWVKGEINWAIKKRAKRIVPILLEDCNADEFHLLLPRIQHIDFCSDPKSGREKLIKLLVDHEYKPHLPVKPHPGRGGVRLYPNWKSTRRVGADEITAEWALEQQGEKIEATVKTTRGPNAGSVYKYQGIFRNSILTLMYVDTDEYSFDRGSLTLKLVEGGRQLEGYLSFYSTRNDRIETCPYVCLADVDAGKKSHAEL